MTADTFSFRLREAMRVRGIKLADVAAAVGKSVQTVHKWVKGGDIEHETLKALAVYLNQNWIRLRHGEQELADVCHSYMDGMPESTMTSIIGNERRFTEIKDAMQIGIWEIDVIRGRVYLCHCLWESMTGEKRSSGWMANKTNPLNFFVREDLPHVLERWHFATRDAKNGDRMLVRYRSKVRSTEWALGVGRVIKDSNGRLIRIIGFSQDESHRRAANQYFESVASQQKRAPHGALSDETP